MITDNLKRLNTLDIYSTLLFVLFKTQNIPSQSTLSELVYILDKNSLLKLCEFYGGQTITIPTIEDLEILTYCLIVYNDVEFEKQDFEKVLKKLPVEAHILKQVRAKYAEVARIMDEYEFFQR